MTGIRMPRPPPDLPEACRALIERSPLPMAAVAGAGHVVRYANPAFCRLVGKAEAAVVGNRFADMARPAEKCLAALDHVYRTGEARTYTEPEQPEPHPAYWSYAMWAVPDAAQRPAGLMIQVTETSRFHRQAAAMNEALLVSSVRQHELTAAANVLNARLQTEIAERVAGNAALRASEAKYRTLFEAIDEGFCIIEKVDSVPGAPSDFRYLAANPAFAVQSGVGSVVGKTIREAFPGEPQEWFDTYDAVLTTGTPVRFERDLATQGRVLELYAVRLEDGTNRRVAVIFADITGRKRHDEHQNMLLHELNHRVKNTLVTVQSLAMQSFRGGRDIPQARNEFEGRLIALAKAHDILTQESWGGAPLEKVVDDAVAPYRSPEGDRFDIEGPHVWLLPHHALALALALHELCTNAVKYGALSNESGRVHVAWSVAGTEVAPALQLRWTEMGGPRVVPPKRRGFGSRLIERGLKQDLGGEVRIDFAATGIVCTIEAPLRAQRGNYDAWVAAPAARQEQGGR